MDNIRQNRVSCCIKYGTQQSARDRVTPGEKSNAKEETEAFCVSGILLKLT